MQRADLQAPFYVPLKPSDALLTNNVMRGVIYNELDNVPLSYLIKKEAFKKSTD